MAHAPLRGRGLPTSEEPRVEGGEDSMKRHPHDLLLQEFAATLSGEPEELLEHLIACGRCQHQLKSLLHPREGVLAGRVWRPNDFQAVPENYDPALASASQRLAFLQNLYEKEQAEAVGLLFEL